MTDQVFGVGPGQLPPAQEATTQTVTDRRTDSEHAARILADQIARDVRRRELEIQRAQAAAAEPVPYFPSNPFGGTDQPIEEPIDEPFVPAAVIPRTSRVASIASTRLLNDAERSLINEAVTLENQFIALIQKIKMHVAMQRVANSTAPEIEAEQNRLDNAEPERWLAMGRTDIQTGTMKIVRAIAQPKTGV